MREPVTTTSPTVPAAGGWVAVGLDGALACAKAWLATPSTMANERIAMLAPANMRVLVRRREAALGSSEFIRPPIDQHPPTLPLTSDDFSRGPRGPVKAQVMLSKVVRALSRRLKLIEEHARCRVQEYGRAHIPDAIFLGARRHCKQQAKLSPPFRQSCVKRATNYISDLKEVGSFIATWSVIPKCNCQSRRMISIDETFGLFALLLRNNPQIGEGYKALATRGSPLSRNCLANSPRWAFPPGFFCMGCGSRRAGSARPAPLP